MKSAPKSATTEDVLAAVQELARGQEDTAQNLQDFIQMTSDWFDKQDESAAKAIERLDIIEGDARELKNASYRHELQLSEFSRTQDKLNDLIKIDIREILARLDMIQSRMPNITKEEVRKLQNEMQQAVDWMTKVSKLKNVPIKFPL